MAISVIGRGLDIIFFWVFWELRCLFAVFWFLYEFSSDLRLRFMGERNDLLILVSNYESNNRGPLQYLPWEVLRCSDLWRRHCPVISHLVVLLGLIVME